MHAHRFYVSPKNIVNNTALITQPEYHHIVDVLRYKEGSCIILFDGEGKEYTGKIKSIDNTVKTVTVCVNKVYKERPAMPLILVQSLIKFGNMNLIIQKATELGVTHIYPLFTANSIIKIEPKSQSAKINKWRRVAEESSKQCGRSRLPSIDKIWNIEEVISSLNWVETKLICTPSNKGMRLKDIPNKKPKSVSVMIGPEGDFTNAELDLVCSGGWIPVHLGETVLRAETAAISVLGAVSYKFGFWD